MNYSTDTEDTTAVLQKFTPKSLHGHIAEFVVGTPDDKETVAPITQYEPLSNDWEVIGCFMLYCEACGYFEE